MRLQDQEGRRVGKKEMEDELQRGRGQARLAVERARPHRPGSRGRATAGGGGGLLAREGPWDRGPEGGPDANSRRGG